ncbi:lipoprotein [Philodulcilactobacillus myokoensis]|uniref:Lipoprotein n=1 Tax=Philodulcilactobacillus myokoensis TaxID=2929573 RepID=A0A9W6B246_9LACO|nr:MetQ/NlpA family ABC transporter substrate-binding protein [Philodulcilactobacillus myokoensis]GLB47500.1 lipoprotein [Philodulcilactobacillus myokoensis]
MKHHYRVQEITLIVLILIVGGFLLTGIHTSSSEKVVKVGVVGTQDNPIWNQVNRNLKAEKAHVKVEPVIFNDGIPANESLSNHQLDLNAFQHYAFLGQEEKTKHYHFKVIGQSYLSPLNIYSKRIKNVSQIKDGDKIAIPNDSTNAGRALKVLESAGLIKTNPAKGNLPTLNDITENDRHLDIIEVDPAAIMKLLPNFAVGITNSNFVQAVGLNPMKDSIFKIAPNKDNPKNKPWINVIVARAGDQNNPDYQKVIKAYQTNSVRKEIHKIYKGVNVPAF